MSPVSATTTVMSLSWSSFDKDLTPGEGGFARASLTRPVRLLAPTPLSQLVQGDHACGGISDIGFDQRLGTFVHPGALKFSQLIQRTLRQGYRIRRPPKNQRPPKVMVSTSPPTSMDMPAANSGVK